MRLRRDRTPPDLPRRRPDPPHRIRWIPTATEPPTTQPPTTEPPTTKPVADDAYSATITRTDHGIPHIVAADLGSVMFGQGYAFAQDRACTVLDQVVKVRSQRSAWFGPGENDANLTTDFAYLHLGLRDRAQTYWEDEAPDLGPRSRLGLGCRLQLLRHGTRTGRTARLVRWHRLGRRSRGDHRGRSAQLPQRPDAPGELRQLPSRASAGHSRPRTLQRAQSTQR